MKATHTDYKHPKHLRVEDGGQVFCLSPSHSQYERLNKAGLPSYINEIAAVLARG